MEFGIQFFPAVGPAERPANEYWNGAIELTRLAESLGFTSVRTVEHYFHPYGGYSPNPIVFLAAAAAVTSKMRLITGAVLPVFNHPLKLAGEIGMLDAISDGRLEVGFARAFLPHEFARFGISLDDSRERFNEGLAQITSLLEEEDVTSDGKFHNYKNVTSLPRPTQQPRPPFWIAALSTPKSFSGAGEAGHGIMAIPLSGSKMAELLGLHRKAWRDAGRPGRGRSMLAFHMFCAETRSKALETSCLHLDKYLKSIVDAASDWASGASTRDYPNYDKIIAGLAKETAETAIEKGSAWIGSPDEIVSAAQAFHEQTGGFDIASMQVHFGNMAFADAEASMRLFAREVMPRLASV